MGVRNPSGIWPFRRPKRLSERSRNEPVIDRIAFQSTFDKEAA